MKIGNLDFGKYPLLLAPMEDVTDESFRLMCKEFGADMVYTEFVSSDALVRNINSTMRKLSIQDAERPVAIQIYGRFVDAMVDAARRCEEANPDVLDINFGCPVKKVAGKGAGAGLHRLKAQLAHPVGAPGPQGTVGLDCGGKVGAAAHHGHIIHDLLGP